MRNYDIRKLYLYFVLLDIKSDKGGRRYFNTGAEQWSDIGGGLFTVGCGEETQYSRVELRKTGQAGQPY